MENDSDREEIFRKFHYRCVRCNRLAVTIHEISPRSVAINPFRIENRVPLCHKCHEWAHEKGTDASKDILIRCREDFLKKYGYS